MFSTLMITFREGLEAFLIIAISLTYLRKTGRTALVPAIHWGISVAVLLSVVLGVVLAKIGAMTPLWEGALALTAAILVIGCTAHMLRLGKQMGREIRNKLDTVGQHSVLLASLAVFAFTVLMIGREGVETATMIASLSIKADAPHLVLGSIIGVSLAGLMAWAWSRYGQKVNLSRFFQVTAVFMLLFSIQLVIYAFHEFFEAGIVPGVDNHFWDLATDAYGPEGTYGMWLSYSLLVLPAAFMLGATWFDRRNKKSNGNNMPWSNQGSPTSN